jgi:c(7)-type cytochrome triheme protein
MRYAIAFFMAVVLVRIATVAAEDKKPPVRLVFPSKAGEVVFDHAAHQKREKGDCTKCHDKLWPKSARAPLKSSAGCRTCHKAGGVSFEMKGNCKKCHAAQGTEHPVDQASLGVLLTDDLLAVSNLLNPLPNDIDRVHQRNLYVRDCLFYSREMQ